jgi:putative phosphoesterase
MKMKIAVISDSHDNIWKLAEAIPHLSETDVILHCGDLVAPFMIKRLAEGLGDIPVHVVWGNNDGDRLLLTYLAAKSGTITMHGDFASLDNDGKRIAMSHFPEIARNVAESEKYDLVCYGHDYTPHQECIGGTLLLNPGELMGMNGKSTLAVYSTETMSIEWIEL